MGAWGAGVLQDDTVADVIGFVADRLKEGDSLAVASTKAESQFAELQSDEDEAPLFWLALAQAQWKYGAIDQDVLNRVRTDIATGQGLQRWQEQPKELSKRKAALAKFLAQIEAPNPKPSAIPKLILRKAPFASGDCLSVLLPDGRYTAALVLREDNSNPEYGKNLIASLDYLDPEQPTVAVFKRKKWLVLTHGSWNNTKDICWFLPVHMKKHRNRITVVANIGSGWLDPKDSSRYAGWDHLGMQVVLCRAHEAKSNG